MQRLPFIFCGKQFSGDGCGLSDEEDTLVKNVSLYVLENLSRKEPWALSRCTFFADRGIDYLVLAARIFPIHDPRIHGDDINPFNQHYWLAYDLLRESQRAEIVLDPIYAYLGKTEFAPETFHYHNERKRRVFAHKAIGDGGVRVKTIGI